MRLGTLKGRAVLLVDGGYVDVESVSDGRFPSDTTALLEHWDELRAWAATTPLDVSPYEAADLGAPVPAPRQVFALAANYLDHAAEAGIDPPEHPYVFTKFPSCITGPYDDVVLSGHRVDWEVELVVVIGRGGRAIAVEDAWDAVAGVTVGQDISDRKVQFRKPLNHLSISKSFPTFGPTGPWLVTTDELPDRDAVPIRCSINGEVVQESTTAQLVFSVPELIAAISAAVTLLPGDLIFTGTPAGVGSAGNPRRYLEAGHVITSEITGIGSMHNTCVKED
jgi:2,4-diketo-3-deoxy-L-fuconate hydrolase